MNSVAIQTPGPSVPASQVQEVAADIVGGNAIQVVKLAAGDVGVSSAINATSGVPGPTALGMVVAVLPGVSVSAQVSGTIQVSGPVQVSGTVTAGAGTTVVSGTLTVNGSVALSGTGLVSVVPGLSVLAQISAVVPVTTQASVSVTGLPIWMSPTQQVVVSGFAVQTTVVSGTLTINGSVSLSGTGLVSVVPGLSVVVSGTVGPLVVSQLNTTGLNVWLAPTQTILVTIQSTAIVSLATGGTIATLLGTVGVALLGTGLVSVVPGLSVLAQISAVVPVTTQASVSVTGLPVWFNPTQQVVVSGYAQTTVVSGTITINGTITSILGTQVVSVVPGLSVSAVVSGTVTVNGTITSILGTQIVSVVPGLSVSAVVSGTVSIGAAAVTTTQSSLTTGLAVWLAPAQTILVTVQSTAIVSLATGGTIATLLGTVGVTQLGTAVVTLATGGTVAILGLVTTTATPSAAGTGAVVWVANPGAAVATTILTVQTVLNTIVVTGTFADLFNTTTQAAGTGDVVWLAPTQTLAVVSTIVTILGTQIVSVVPGLSVSAVVSGTVTVSGLSQLYTTALATGASTAQIVLPKDFARIQVMIVVSSTVIGSNTTMLFTVYTNNQQATAGVSIWPVPAGQVLRINRAQLNVGFSAVAVVANLCVLAATAAASVTMVATVGLAVNIPYFLATTQQFGWVAGDIGADISAGTTIGVGVSGGTSHSVLGAVLQGYLF